MKSWLYLKLHVFDTLVLLVHVPHVDLFVVVLIYSIYRRHVRGPDPRVLDRLRYFLLVLDLDALPVQEQEERDGGPDDGGGGGAANAHLQCRGHVYQLFTGTASPGGGSAVPVCRVLAVPLPGQLVVVEVEPGVVVCVSEQGPTHVRHGGHLAAEGQGPVQLPPGLVLQLPAPNCIRSDPGKLITREGIEIRENPHTFVLYVPNGLKSKLAKQIG